jgi:hypothetical protein
MPESSQFPLSIIALNFFSLFIAICVLILSIQDCGILSLCLNPLFAIITVGYHVGMLALAYRRPDDAPVLPIGYSVWAYFLSLSWLGAYIAMAMVLLRKQKEIPLFDIRIIIPQHLKCFQRLQMLLDPLECVILGDLAIKGTIQWRAAKVDLSKEQMT